MADCTHTDVNTSVLLALPEPILEHHRTSQQVAWETPRHTADVPLTEKEQRRQWQSGVLSPDVQCICVCLVSAAICTEAASLTTKPGHASGCFVFYSPDTAPCSMKPGGG